MSKGQKEAKPDCEVIPHENDQKIGPCSMYDNVLTQQCYCGRSQREVECGQMRMENFSCDNQCGREMNCGNHLCELPCHSPPCPPCPLLPLSVTTCPCGATPLPLLLSSDCSRSSCLDSIPTCDRRCKKRLPCSTHAEPHICPVTCHEGGCPPCKKSRTFRCRCRHGSVRVECVEVKNVDMYTCEHPCNEMKTCGRHRCKIRCCMYPVHPCDLVCGKKLQCVQHLCQETCHKGECNQCQEISHTKLQCHCGASVRYPPIPCGTQPPACNKPCARPHPCSHPVTHSCHNEDKCPPCTVLTEKKCMGGHEVRRNIPCHITDVLCSTPCGAPLPCGDHKCLKICHRGPCTEPPEKCRQPCPKLRTHCTHICAEYCHVGECCPDTRCKAVVILTYKRERRREEVRCGASSAGVMQPAFHKILSKDLEEKIHILQSGQSVSLGLQDAVNSPTEPSIVVPQYSDLLLDLARRNFEFTATAEEEMRSFVDSVLKGSSSQMRRHRFSPMNSYKRKLLHELAPHYGCESLSYDEEPHRHVTINTNKIRAMVPSVSLFELIERDI